MLNPQCLLCLVFRYYSMHGVKNIFGYDLYVSSKISQLYYQIDVVRNISACVNLLINWWGLLKCVIDLAFPYGFFYPAENRHKIILSMGMKFVRFLNIFQWAYDISCRTNSFSKLYISDTTQTGPGFCWLLQFLFSLSSSSTPRYSWESGQNLKVDDWLWI